MTPRVIIYANSNLDDVYESVMAHVNAVHHAYHTTFPEYPTSEEEYGDLQTYAKYAEHATCPPGADVERTVV